MNTREYKLLEAVFSAEIESALSPTPKPHIYQTKSKLAEKLEAEGLLKRITVTLGGRFPVSITGYELTQLGRLHYCTNC